MSNVVFYKDTKDNFECDIKVEGTSLSQSKARLVLKFSDRAYLFEGSISKDGHVKVEVPPLTDYRDESGTATLEVIAESTFFEAWTSPFELKNKKEIRVQEVSISSSTNKVVVENVSAQNNLIKEVEPKRNGNIYNENVSKKNMTFVKEVFDGYQSLTPKQRNKVKHTLKEFRFNPLIERWGKSVFKDTSTPYARLCMMQLQESMKRKK